MVSVETVVGVLWTLRIEKLQCFADFKGRTGKFPSCATIRGLLLLL